MSQANLRVSSNLPYLYLEGDSAALAAGLDSLEVFNIVVSPNATDIDPESGTPSISIDPAANGNIEFAPKGTGQSTFVNGDVEIAAGNLEMQDTDVGGTEGVINYGGDRFIHNKGTKDRKSTRLNSSH